jgi:hypothetical protein
LAGPFTAVPSHQQRDLDAAIAGSNGVWRTDGAPWVNFESRNASGGVDVSSGWYVDEVTLLHDPALVLFDSPVVRTQETACVSLGIAVGSLASGASFLVEAPPEHLNNAMLSAEGCWSGAITRQSSTQWLINLASTCTAAAMGVQTVGTICFTAVSPHSAFVPLTVSSLVISNLTPALAFGARIVNVASEPLLEAWLAPNQQTMATLYGIAGQMYEIRHAASVDAPSPWTPGWTNTVPASLFTTFPLTGDSLEAPALFLRANEL